MSTLVLTQAEIRRLLPMGECIELVGRALAALSAGEVVNPLRHGVRLEGGRILGMMPGATADPRTLGIKVVTVFPDNHGGPLDSHQGVVLLFDPENGAPTAILDASEVTAIRTAAASGLATRLLARKDARELALLGSGVQARTHLEAMLAVRPLTRVRVHSPDPENRRRFAERAAARHGLPVEATDTARAAVEGADVVCTTTSAREPVLHGAWLAPGAHVNAVGACMPSARELDTEAVLRARIFVDSRESALKESGDLLEPLRAGEMTEEAIAGELGELLLGRVNGRRDDREVTLFESLGVAVEDLVVAEHVVRRARAEGIGRSLDLGGLRELDAADA